jgi:hypothetical protein
MKQEKNWMPSPTSDGMYVIHSSGKPTPRRKISGIRPFERKLRLVRFYDTVQDRRFCLPPTSTMPIRVQGNWVTESGDTIYAGEADATPGAPITGSLTDGTMFNVSAAIYKDGLKITGGTGRFKGASGKLKLLFGAGDSVNGQFIYRYQGTICVPESQD